jgi:hypothetical protein
MQPSGVDSLAVSVFSTPMLNSSACVAACSCSSAISSTLPSARFSCFRWFRRSALSLCLCCRVCSFWRFVNVDRPLGISIPRNILCSYPRHFLQPHRELCVRRLPTRFAQLTRTPAVVVAPTAAFAAKTMAATPGTLGLGFGLVDGEGSSVALEAKEKGGLEDRPNRIRCF